ncbi:MAG: alpha/beta hydrolase domain-containing protein, partial [Alphaproteobacteria bacterium]
MPKRPLLKLAASMTVLTAAMALTGSIVTAQSAAAQAASRVPNPTVTGPIASHGPLGSPAHDYPWGATMHNLAAVGYVEEEYFFSGTANRYNTPAGQPATVRDSGHKYVTRMLVRRPIDPKKFNGTVLAEWTNVTPGYDLDAMWGATFEQMIRGGYAWVGISAQRVGLQQPPNGLKLWSPTRYASIDVTEGGTIMTDDLSYDIYAQGMQAIKSPGAVNPLGALKAKRVIAMGASQSAGRLGTYINSLHAMLGGPVDAYILSIGGARINDDIPVPVFKELSETDAIGQVPSRQPDTNKYRQWEIVGASHSGQRTGYNSGALNRRDGITREAAVCDHPMWPRVPINLAAGNIYPLMDKWLDGTPPPIAPKAEVVTRDIDGKKHEPLEEG